MGARHRVALDSNPLSFYCDAMRGGYDPAEESAPVARERCAVLRAYLYSGHSYTLLRSVVREYRRIADPERLRLHEAVAAVLLLDAVPSPPAREVDALVAQYLPYHRDPDDCRILAEANALRVPYLLTFDLRFLRNLAARSQITQLLLPSEYWRLLGVPAGATPRRAPNAGHPLASSLWWRV